jgi:3-phosphoshikimate 1-carboxyvinyltransferase
VEQDGDRVRIHGRGRRGFDEPADVLDCGNSGTTMRLLTGVLAGSGVYAVLNGDASLRRRPMARVVEPLGRAGARIQGRDGGRLAPLTVTPVASLTGVEHSLSVASAQVKSSLLLAGLFADGPTSVVEPARTRDHTERMLRAMGGNLQQDGLRCTIAPSDVRCVDVPVPGDFSSAAYWLVLGVLHPRAEVRVRDVGANPSRTGLLTILERMGANVAVENRREIAGEPVADLVAWSSQLRGTSVQGELVPLAIDELPLVALLGLFAEGDTVVRDAAELRAKESDRLAVVAEGLQHLGGAVTATADGWRISGGSGLRGGEVDAHDDHRMAMLFALAGAVGEGAAIRGAESVAISYPAFWEELQRITVA